MIIAVDFDGTIVEHKYPAIGNEIPFATETLKMLIRDHHRLILWSVREGQLLEDAVNWCRERGVEFWAVNKDYPEETTATSADCLTGEPSTRWSAKTRPGTTSWKPTSTPSPIPTEQTSRSSRKSGGSSDPPPSTYTHFLCRFPQDRGEPTSAGALPCFFISTVSHILYNQPIILKN